MGTGEDAVGGMEARPHRSWGAGGTPLVQDRATVTSLGRAAEPRDADTIDPSPYFSSQFGRGIC